MFKFRTTAERREWAATQGFRDGFKVEEDRGQRMLHELLHGKECDKDGTVRFFTVEVVTTNLPALENGVMSEAEACLLGMI